MLRSKSTSVLLWQFHLSWSFHMLAWLQTQHQSVFVAISGDSNLDTMDTALPTFTKYVSCPTREERTLDLLYANVKDNKYSSSPLPPLVRSDLVHLNPCEVPLVRSQPATTRTVRRWSEEAYETLQGCFQVTQSPCELLGEDIDRLTECITDSINFCVDLTVSAETVHCYPNNKLRVTNDIKEILDDNRRAFRAGNREEVGTIQGHLKVMFTEGKENYRRKLEQKLQQNTREAWRGMRTITGWRCSIPAASRTTNLWHWPPTSWSSWWTHLGADLAIQTTLGLPTDRPLAPTWNWGCLHLLKQPCLCTTGQAGKHCERHVFWLLRCIQHHPSSSTGWEADSDAGDSPPLVTWIIDYLTGRPQCVHLQHCVSDKVVSNTGAPQSTVLSPFLFTPTPQTLTTAQTLSSPWVLRWLSNSWTYQWGQDYCGQPCHMVWVEPSTAQCDKYQGTNCGPEGCHWPLFPSRRSVWRTISYGGFTLILKTGLKKGQYCPLQEGTESSLFFETAEVRTMIRISVRHSKSEGGLWMFVFISNVQ